jgi:hypothetical protein
MISCGGNGRAYSAAAYDGFVFCVASSCGRTSRADLLENFACVAPAVFEIEAEVMEVMNVDRAKRIEEAE